MRAKDMSLGELEVRKPGPVPEFDEKWFKASTRRQVSLHDTTNVSSDANNPVQPSSSHQAEANKAERIQAIPPYLPSYFLVCPHCSRRVKQGFFSWHVKTHSVICGSCDLDEENGPGDWYGNTVTYIKPSSVMGAPEGSRLEVE